MAQNEIKAKPALPERVRSMEWLDRIVEGGTTGPGVRDKAEALSRRHLVAEQVLEGLNGRDGPLCTLFRDVRLQLRRRR